MHTEVGGSSGGVMHRGGNSKKLPSFYCDHWCLLSSSSDHLLSEEEELLASGLSDEQDPGGESFEKLFSRFAQMKGWCWPYSLLSRALS